MNGPEYLRILQDITLPAIRATISVPQDLDEVYVMQDNSPVHTSLLVRQYLRTQYDIKWIPMPALSPDLNPIENMWARMFHEVPQMIPGTEDALWGYCQGKWEALNNDPQLFQQFTHSMKRRLEAVIQAGGGHTKY